MMGYVDNFGVLATSSEIATDGAKAVRRVLESKGLRIHATVASDVEADFIGLCFNLRELSVGLRPSRSYRLRAAIRELVRRGHCSPVLLEIIMGHCTWAALLRREALSVFDACYRFVQQGGTRALPLPSAVRRELLTFQAILPLLSVELAALGSRLQTRPLTVSGSPKKIVGLG